MRRNYRGHLFKIVSSGPIEQKKISYRAYGMNNSVPSGNSNRYPLSNAFLKKLKYSCFTRLCQFQVYSTVILLYIFFFRFFSFIGYYKILNIVPCAVEKVLVGYLFYMQQCVYINPNFLIYSSFTPGIKSVTSCSIY